MCGCGQLGILQANVTVTLEIDTEYSVTVMVGNNHGMGPSSAPVLIRTLEEGGNTTCHMYMHVCHMHVYHM